MLKQRLFGLGLAAIGVLMPILDNGDATSSIILVPLGLLLLFSKENLLIGERKDK